MKYSNSDHRVPNPSVAAAIAAIALLCACDTRESDIRGRSPVVDFTATLPADSIASSRVDPGPANSRQTTIWPKSQKVEEVPSDDAIIALLGKGTRRCDSPAAGGWSSFIDVSGGAPIFRKGKARWFAPEGQIVMVANTATVDCPERDPATCAAKPFTDVKVVFVATPMTASAQAEALSNYGMTCK